MANPPLCYCGVPAKIHPMMAGAPYTPQRETFWRRTADPAAMEPMNDANEPGIVVTFLGVRPFGVVLAWLGARSFGAVCRTFAKIKTDNRSCLPSQSQDHKHNHKIITTIRRS
jgi:hypothetical protein